MPALKPELSERSKYWISKHRYYELKHFCLQYPDWKRLYSDLEFKMGVKIPSLGTIRGAEIPDPTAKYGQLLADLQRALDLVSHAATDADPELGSYILKAVTEGLSFVDLEMSHKIPCGKDMYYDAYRRFFWLLSQRKGI